MALIMQCVSLFLQFLWATGLLLASKLVLSVQHPHLKQISCGNLTDYFSHFRFPWSWSPFSTCSSGPSAPCMVRPLWLVCWFHHRSFELLELLYGQSFASISSASTSETDILWKFENRVLPTLLQLPCSLNTSDCPDAVEHPRTPLNSGTLRDDVGYYWTLLDSVEHLGHGPDRIGHSRTLWHNWAPLDSGWTVPNTSGHS